MSPEFVPFPKIPRLSREIVVTEKLDGTNASVFIADDGYTIRFGSRTRWLEKQSDNFGFWSWANANTEELLKLGPGHHFGEWWGLGIQRGYGLDKRKFSLFNTARWSNPEVRPACCDIVPVLYQGNFDELLINHALNKLFLEGSVAAPGFMKPEGVIIYHTAANMCFKKTIDNNDGHKG